MDLNALKEAAFEAFGKIFDYLRDLLETFISDKIS